MPKVDGEKTVYPSSQQSESDGPVKTLDGSKNHHRLTITERDMKENSASF